MRAKRILAKQRKSGCSPIDLRCYGLEHSPALCGFFLRAHDVLSASSLTLAGSLRFMRQKKERRAPGQRRDPTAGTSVRTGSMAASNPVRNPLH